MLRCPDCYNHMKNEELSGEKWHICTECGNSFSDEIYQETSYQRYLWKRSKFKKVWNNPQLNV